MRLYSGGGKRQLSRQSSPRRRGGKHLQPAPRGRLRRGVGALAACGAALMMATVSAGGPDALLAEDLPAQTLSPAEHIQETAEPQTRFVLSFAGDCTLGAEHDSWNRSGNFPDVVGTDYAYPFSGVLSLFGADDFTFVNLEGVLTDYHVPAQKTYRFRGPPEYAQILTEGSVEAVTLANNHTLDYGTQGLADTRQALEDAGIAACGDCETLLVTTDSGLRIGIYAAYHLDRTRIRSGIEDLQQQGAEVIVAAFHSGTEGSYQPTAAQESLFRYAADCGAHIVYNSHPHVLGPMEFDGEHLILSSMGNFCFGGNRNPTDKDTAVVQVTVERTESGIELTEVTAIPCSVTSTPGCNDYRPSLCEADGTAAGRIARKLAGTYRAPAAAQTDQPQTAPSAVTGSETSAAAPSQTEPEMNAGAGEQSVPPASEAPQDTPGSQEPEWVFLDNGTGMG